MEVNPRPRRRKAKKVVKKRRTSNSNKYWAIEAVVDKRIRNGKLQYKIKWEGFPESNNTWEPLENLNEETVPDVCALEEKIHSSGKSTKVESTSATRTSESKTNSASELKPTLTLDTTGYDLGYEVEEIITLKDIGTSRFLLVKWKEQNMAELLPFELVKMKSPQVVIQFFEMVFDFQTNPLVD